MKTYIALLRGVNVSGQKKVPMSDLRKLLENVGLLSVQTYIQSGNVVFQSSENNIPKLAAQIHLAIKKHYGFEVPVLVKTSSQFQQIFNNCPFPVETITKSYFALLYSIPDEELVEEVEKLSIPNEEFAITCSCAYLYCSTGYGKAKLNNNFIERKLKTIATTRNYKTMVKLLALASGK